MPHDRQNDVLPPGGAFFRARPEDSSEGLSEDSSVARPNLSGPDLPGPNLPVCVMNGLGNRFVIIDARRHCLDLEPGAVKALARQGSHFRFDQLIVLHRAGNADLAMQIFNRDGSRPAVCGNATRCVAALSFHETGRDTASILTENGILQARRDSRRAAGDDAGHAGDIAIDMGTPHFGWRDIPLSRQIRDTSQVDLRTGAFGFPCLERCFLVSMGNPHAIIWEDDEATLDLARLGPVLEHHDLFPERANISLARISGSGDIAARVWERGAGLTTACGSAACAIAVGAACARRSARTTRVHLPGGALQIDWRADNHVIMSGPVTYEFAATLDTAQMVFSAGHGTAHGARPDLEPGS